MLDVCPLATRAKKVHSIAYIQVARTRRQISAISLVLLSFRTRQVAPSSLNWLRSRSLYIQTQGVPEVDVNIIKFRSFVSSNMNFNYRENVCNEMFALILSIIFCIYNLYLRFILDTFILTLKMHFNCVRNIFSNLFVSYIDIKYGYIKKKQQQCVKNLLSTLFYVFNSYWEVKFRPQLF